MPGVNKGLGKVEVRLQWDPSPLGTAPHDLDIITAVYTAEDPHGKPAYLVYFDSRSPDGTIVLTRDSLDGRGLGPDEIMVLELDRLALRFTRVVVGVAIQQRYGRRTFEEIANPLVVIAEGHTELTSEDFIRVSGATAATVAEFNRKHSGEWELRAALRGFEGDPESFVAVMGSRST
jgi:tellurium resistance protein TerD